MTQKTQHGFILITVLFLIAVVAVIAVNMSTTRSVQSFTSAYALQQARANTAAQSGLEYGVQRAVVPAGAGVCTNGGITLPGINFTVTLVCVSVPGINEAGNITEVFTVTSTATTGTLGNVGFVTRTVRAQVN